MPWIDQFELLEELSRGAMGVVYRARDANLGREVALKLSGQGLDTEGVSRFRREGQSLARLRHPSLVVVLAAGLSEGRPYLAMELVPGESLQERVRRLGRLEPSEVASLGAQLARGLAAAHAQGIVHRDVKPANAVLDQAGRVVLVDFGLARELDRNTRLTEDGALVGTPAFMAPEQARGESDCGPPSDVWGLGATLHCLLSGSPPFLGGGTVETLELVLTRSPPPLPESVPEPLAALVRACLAKSPGERPSAEALAAALEAFCRPPPAPSGPGRRGVAIAGVAAVSLSAALGAALMSSPRDGQAEVAPAPAAVVSSALPSPPPTTIDDVRVALELKAWARARALAEALVSSRPEDGLLQVLLARALAGEGQEPEQQRALANAESIALRLDARDPARARLVRAWKWLAEGRAAEVLDSLQDPQGAEALELVGEAHLQERRLIRARLALAGSLKLEPSPARYRSLARAHLALDGFKEARQVLAMAARAGCDDPAMQALKEEADRLAKDGLVQRVETATRKRDLDRLAEEALRAGRPGLSLRAARRLEQLSDRDPEDGWVRTAEACLALGELDEAEKAAGSLTRVYPGKADGYLLRARVLDRRGQRPAARELLKETLSHTRLEDKGEERDVRKELQALGGDPGR